MSEQVM